MFLGTPFSFEAVGYVPRRRPRKGQWNHWGIKAIREGNSECALQSVGVIIFSARKSRKGFVETRDFSISHFVYLGNVNRPEERRRIRNPCCIGKNTIDEELRSIVAGIQQCIQGRKRNSDPIKTYRLDSIVCDVCLIPDNPKSDAA